MDREKGTPVGTKIISIISPSVIIIIIIIIKPCVYTRPTVGGKRKTLELELEILLFHFFFVLNFISWRDSRSRRPRRIKVEILKLTQKRSFL